MENRTMVANILFPLAVVARFLGARQEVTPRPAAVAETTPVTGQPRRSFVASLLRALSAFAA
jgi:hypothetical protein